MYNMLNFVVGQQSICLLTGLLKYLPINMNRLVQKLGGGKKMSKSVSGSGGHQARGWRGGGQGLKVTGHSKKFVCCYITFTFKRPSLQLFRFKCSQLIHFLRIFDSFCGLLIKEGTNSEILNLNNQRLMILKVHVI